MKIKLFEEFKNSEIPKFAIDIRGTSDDDLIKILNILKQYANLRFNGASNEMNFINYKDTQGKAWCWRVEPETDFWREKFTFFMSGVHTYGWYREDLMGHMIDWKDFIKLGLEKSIEKMKKEVEHRRIEKDAKKYNL